MRRLLAIALGFLLTAALVVGGAAALFFDEAVARGRERHVDRERLLRRIERQHPELPLVVWLGDSTILSYPGRASYPKLIQQRQQGEIENLLVAQLGLDFFHYYYLMGPILDLDPDLVVVVANLRSFVRDRRLGSRVDLASLIPASELWRAARLPLQHRDLTLPRLLLLRMLRSERAAELLYFADGLRQAAWEAPLWGRLGESARPPPPAEWDPLREVPLDRLMLMKYNRPIHPSHPVVEMMEATVEMASRRGVPVLVFASPLPYTEFAEDGWYDPAVFGARIDVLRKAVERGGGALLDLHRLVPGDGFFDFMGHFNASGHGRIARRLEPLIRAQVERGHATRSH